MSGTSKTVWVAGEALIDLVPLKGKRIPIVGGGPANTAKALSRLGINTSFIGGISSDDYGKLIEDELLESKVDLSLANRSDLPSALAAVTLDSAGIASYEFKLDRTATFDFGTWLPEGQPSVLHVGTLATIVQPGAESLFYWASKMGAPIVFDPNIRPSVLSDKSKYRESVARWAGISLVIKLSDDDLDWLGYSVKDLLRFGAELIVLTRGEVGISAIDSGGEIMVPAKKIDVVDTVGAGDTVGAVIVEGILKYGEIKGEVLRGVLQRAVNAAAITCSRQGANPPKYSEII